MVNLGFYLRPDQVYQILDLTSAGIGNHDNHTLYFLDLYIYPLKYIIYNT